MNEGLADLGESAARRVLPRSFYDRGAEEVARELLGKWLVRRADDGLTRVGRVVETEAYLGPHDLASHSSKGRTPRTEAMFGPPGHAYVYLIYGMHHCLNAVTGQEGEAAAVLIRALEPVQRIEGDPRGPGRLCRLLGIDRGQNRADLTDPSAGLFFALPEPGEVDHVIVARPRVGVDYAGDWAQRHLRFLVKDSPFISRK